MEAQPPDLQRSPHQEPALIAPAPAIATADFDIFFRNDLL